MNRKDKKSALLDNSKTTGNFNLLSSTPELRRKAHLSKHVCLHISEVSAVMVGICLAGVGLIDLAHLARRVDGYIYDLLAVDSLAFTITCCTAFGAFRSPNLRKTLRLEKVSEIFFSISLFLMLIITLLTVYSSIKHGPL
jgi:hypothetical protein